eukprot:1159599-Alexandrium_andersonii.AAC.1
MTRSVSQAEINNAGAHWVRALPWRAAKGDQRKAAPQKACDKPLPTTAPQKSIMKRPAGASAADSYIYGYDSFMCKAWRALPSKPQARSMCERIVAPKSRADSGMALAIWADGSSWSVPELTCATVRGWSAGRAEGAVLWKGVHAESHHTLQIKPK